MGLFFLLAAMAPTALAGAMEVGATRFAAGEYARAVDAPRLRLRPPADYRAKPPQKRYSVTVLYRQRHKIENMFGRIKDWRRVHTRYDRCVHTKIGRASSRVRGCQYG